MSEHKNTPAFPAPKFGGTYALDTGLTKREFFAAMAMQGLSAHAYRTGESSAKVIAAWAIEQADALIAALNEPQP